MYTDELIYCNDKNGKVVLPDSVPDESWCNELKQYWVNAKKELAKLIDASTKTIHVEVCNNVNSITETINTMHKLGYDLASDVISEASFGVMFCHMFFQKTNNLLNTLTKNN